LALDAEAVVTTEIRTIAVDKSVLPITAVDTTLYAVGTAKDLPTRVYPGAFSPKITIRRVRRSGEWVNQLVVHLSDTELFPDADAGIKNTRDGILYLRRISRSASYRLCRTQFTSVGLTPPYKQEYLILVSGREY